MEAHQSSKNLYHHNHQSANYFRTKNCDTGGCSAVAEFIVKRDTTAPTGGSVGNTNGYQTTTGITVNVNPGVDNESGMSANNADYTLKVASATLSAGSCGGFGAYADAGVAETASAASYTYTGVNAKCYKFSYDVKNSVAIPATWTGTDITKIDTTDPTPPGTPSSVSNYSYTGNISISWLASTDTGSGISYYYLAQSSDFGSNYAAANPSNVNSPATSWSPASALPEGAYRYTVRAFDAAGRQSTLSSASADIRVDKTAPTITSFSVSPATANPTQSFTITRAASDNTNGSGIKTYQVYRAPFSSSNKCNDSDKSNCVWSDLGDIPSDPASPGTYYYGLHITDNALNCITEDTKGDGLNNGGSGTAGHCPGGVASDSVVRTDFGPIKVTKLSDTTPPTISAGAVAPSNNVSGTLYTNDSTPTLSVTTDENATCKFDFTDKAYSGQGSMLYTFDGTTTSHSKTLTTTQSDDPKTVYVRCQDTASPVNTNGTSYSFGYTVDTVAPGGGDITWRVITNKPASSNFTTDTSALTTVSAKSVGSTTSNYPTIEIQYTDSGSGIQTPAIDTPLEPQVSFKGGLPTDCSTLFPIFTLNGTQYNACSTTNNKLTFTVPWSQGVDNNKANAIVIPLNFIKDGAGNTATGPDCTNNNYKVYKNGALCITINNQAPIIR